MKQETFLGGAIEKTISANWILRIGEGRIWILNPVVALRIGQLPDARVLPLSPGETAFRLYNVGTNSVSIVRQDLVVIGSIAPGKYSDILLADASTQAGVWYMQSSDIKGGPPPWNGTTTTTPTTTTGTATTTTGNTNTHPKLTSATGSGSVSHRVE